MRTYRQNVVKDGQTLTVAKWYADVRFSGKRYRLPLFEDQKSSKDFAAMLGIMIGQYEAGRSYDKRVELWLNQLNPSFLTKFCKWGLLDTARAESGRGIDEHLKQYEAYKQHKGDSDNHIQRCLYRIRAVVNACGFRKVSDFSTDRIQKHLHDEVEGDRISQQTANHYRSCLKAFVNWLYRTDKIDRDPLKNLTMRRIDERKKNRRAMTIDEISYLLGWVSTAGQAFDLTGWDRMVLYKLALTTGLRAAEIRSLQCRSIDVRAKSVVVLGAYTKNRKQANLPLRDDVLKDLKELIKGKTPTATLFAKVTDRTADMLQADLDGARQQYKKEGGKDADFLKIETADGEVDFHSLRHSYATLLVNSGTDVKTAQSLLRHANPMLTLGIYSHVLRESEQSAVAKLPSFDIMKQDKKKA